jgi:subfamily B ATP-binding cassette protein MsbA
MALKFNEVLRASRGARTAKSYAPFVRPAKEITRRPADKLLALRVLRVRGKKLLLPAWTSGQQRSLTAGCHVSHRRISPAIKHSLSAAARQKIARMTDFLRKLWEFARPYRWRLFLGVVTGILAALMAPLLIIAITLVSTLVFQPAAGAAKPIAVIPAWMPAWVQAWLDSARAGMDSGLREHPSAVILLVATIPLAMLLARVMGYLNTYFLQWTAIRTITDLRTKLFSHLLRLSAGFFNQSRSGELISRIMNDTYALQTVVSGATSIIVRDPVILIGLLGLLLWRQPMMTLISLVVLPVCMIPLSIYSRKIRRASREMQSQNADLMQVMTESFSGHRVVKAYNLENVVTDEFRQTARKSIGQYMRIVRASELSSPIIDLLASIGVALALLYMIYLAHAHPNPGDFIQLAASIVYMYAPMKNLTRLHNQLTQARAASERVFELLATTNSVPEPAQPKMLHALHADIEFQNLDFSYGEKPVLHNINLTVKAGQLVALVGASGAGKTTLANLLLRFYDPVHGAVKIGGVDLRDVRTFDLRNQTAVVTQETVLFNDTVRRNIELGRLGATEEEIIAAARNAYAYDFIMQKPEGFDAVIGEKGVSLSGGQRQRLAIARAVLKNAPILVLDEATSALDTESERAVQAALDELMKGRTTLCIAHRLSTILHADLIVVLDQGRIVETGKHAELVQRGGIYQKLYELQFQS